MSKKFVCRTVRICEMAVALTILQQVYQIGALGYFLVGLTGLVWAVTSDIEHDE